MVEASDAATDSWNPATTGPRSAGRVIRNRRTGALPVPCIRSRVVACTVNSLIYLAHGPAALRAEAFYSLLSYYQVAAVPVQVLVYTDAPEAFGQVLGPRPEIIYPAVTAMQWQEWRGSSNKVFMLKIGVLTHAATHYPGNLLFVDTDTIWQRDPAPLFSLISQGQLIMHVIEERMSTGNTLSRKVYKHLKDQTFSAGPRSIRLMPETLLYNSGVLGFPSSMAAELPAITSLADQLFAAYDKHIMEQLAFSIYFHLSAPVAEAAPYVLHYWNLKAARPYLARVFEKYAGHSLDELYQRATALDLPRLHAAELAYRNLPGWHRTWLKLQGRRWRMPELAV